MQKSFDALITGPTSGPILQAINDLNIKEPSEIQSQAIPILCENKSDLIVQSQVNTGKTIALLASMLLHVDGQNHYPQTICLCHSYELITRIYKIFCEMNKYTQFKGAICVNNPNNNEPPPQYAQLLFGTPTSLAYYIRKKEIDVSHINLLTIYEANRLLDNHSSIDNLIKLLPENIQYGFFSTSFRNSVVDFYKKQRPGITIIRHRRFNNAEHLYTKVEKIDQAKDLVFELVSKPSNVPAHLFVRNYKHSHEFHNFLESKGISCKIFSSDLSPQDRSEIIEKFTKNEIKVLIVSDVSVSDIYTPNSYLVINCQTPIIIEQQNNQKQQKPHKIVSPDFDTYLSRSQKAGHYGLIGICFTIVTDDKDENNLKGFFGSKNIDAPLNFIGNDQLSTIPEERKIDQ